MPKFLIYIFVPFLLFSCKTSYQPYSEGMKKKLEEMYKDDQRAQNFDELKIKKFGKTYIDSMNTEIDRIFKGNTDTLKKYFKSHSYPWVNLNDEKTAIYFWTIIQHSDYDVEFQKEVLKVMEKGIRNKTVVLRNYAFLYDRVMLNTNQKQLYGTQLKWIDNTPQPYPELEFPEKVDELRKKLGLISLQEYYTMLLRIKPNH